MCVPTELSPQLAFYNQSEHTRLELLLRWAEVTTISLQQNTEALECQTVGVFVIPLFDIKTMECYAVRSKESEVLNSFNHKYAF